MARFILSLNNTQSSPTLAFPTWKCPVPLLLMKVIFAVSTLSYTLIIAGVT